MMKKEQLVKVSAQFYRYVREQGNVEILVERYSRDSNKNVTALWVVNGVHEFDRQNKCFSFCSKLADEIGGNGVPTIASHDNIIKSYSEEVKAAAILG